MKVALFCAFLVFAGVSVAADRVVLFEEYTQTG